ncbi:MAG: FHA domain-containing protein [Clostridia bacterium]|nr:FHA domain-containing protein [Clostridia bacterium]
MAYASENEQFKLAVIGEEVLELNDYTCDFSKLKEQVLAIEYINCDLNLCGGLIQILNQWNIESQQWMFENAQEPYFKRIILLTDGEQSLQSLQQLEELNQLLGEYSCPIDIVALSHNTDSEESMWLNAVSRKSNGRFYTLDDVGTIDMDMKPEKKEMNPVIEALLSDRDVMHLTVIPDQTLRNGATMKSRLTLRQQGVEQLLLVNLRLPFPSQQELQTENEELHHEENLNEQISSDDDVKMIEKKLLSEQEQSKNLKEELAALQKGQEEENARWMIIVICIMLIVTAILSIFYRLFLWLSHKRNQEIPLVQPFLVEEQKTVLLKNEFSGRQREMSGYAEGETTMLLFQSDDVYEISLTDQSNPANYFSFPLKDSVIIGRNSNESHVVISCEPSISAKHCELSQKNSRFFIKDLDSANGTRINGIKTVSETEIFSGNLLRLGQLELKIGWCLNE